ncbi:MAG: rhomboid family intramembrane serine protease [Verrucomicrobiaceae bacterium]|nr:rhomboid family intramembrane serine protease [Verrucomicrobiaceae bacterium]
MSLLVSLEQKFGRFAIPNLVRVLTLFHVLNWFLIRWSPGFPEKLMFVPALIRQGEWWRLVSYLALPGGSSILWLLLGVPFLWMINDGLEQAWGSFRLNLFILGGVVCTALGGLVSPEPSTGWALWAGLLMAFAVYFPDQEILLFLILPVRIKWLAMLTAAGIGFQFLGGTGALRWHILFSLLPFLVTFGPGFARLMKHRGEVKERRQRFEAASRREEAWFHKCTICGKTEIDDPALDFRTTAEGDEACDKCRAKKKDAP